MALTLLFITLLQAATVTATCYTPNGTSRNAIYGVPDGWDYAPCDNYATYSMCCAIGPGRAAQPDRCINGTGLCTGGDGTTIWRESCTDPTWQDPACIKLFLNGTGYNETDGIARDDGGQIITDVEVTSCDDGSWCYGTDNRACCQQKQGYFVVNGEQVKQNPNSTSSSTSTSTVPTPSSTFSSVSSSSPTPAASGSKSNSLSTGAKAGIGVGAALGVLAVLAALWWFVAHLKKSRASHATSAERSHFLGAGQDIKKPNIQEMSSAHEGPRVEMESPNTHAKYSSPVRYPNTVHEMHA